MALAVLSSGESAGLTRAQARDLCGPFFQGQPGPAEAETAAFLDGLVNQGFLVKQGRDRLAFQHPLLLAYCAATALAADPEGAAASIPAFPTPLWSLALYFLAPVGDLTPVVKRLLTQPPDVLQTEPLLCARWLRDTPAAVPWRNDLFRRLSKLMLDTSLPEGLRLRALAAFAASGDVAVAALFKQALVNDDPFTRRLSALGLGLLGDGTAVAPLAALFSDSYLDVRWAAALALAAVGTDVAIGTLKQGLTLGDDGVRQACAQALARHTEAGHALLKEGLTHPELSTRRAAILGLAEIGGDEVIRLVEERQRQEQEWFVRNAANEVVHRLKEAPPDRSPRPYIPPESQGWLISWAAARGMGVPPGRAALEVLNRALREGEEATRLAAAESLARLGDPAAALQLYTALRDPEFPLVRDAAYRALAQISAATGQRLHAPS
jgi:HEAT repeat protein